MRRWHEDVVVMTRRLRHWSMDEYRPQDLGRWRKRHPLDCGRPKCGCCHFEKFSGVNPRGNQRRKAISIEMNA